jgi:endo-1,4-beta-xylanase
VKLYKIISNTIILQFFLLTITVGSGCSHEPVLKKVFADDFLIGGALNEEQIYGRVPKKEREIVKKHFNTITPENILKWQYVHPGPGVYDFKAADKMVALGKKHNMFVVGHTLVWHHQTPGWVFQNSDGNDTSREVLLRRMKSHIFRVVRRYKGKVHGWDVVNEALDADGNLQKTKWLEIIGEDYIEKAFEYAHQADPDAELYYNDFDMWKSSKFGGVARIVKDLQSKGLRIDGVGMQGHWGFDYPLNEELEAAIVFYSKLGMKVMVTELDISVLPNLFAITGADITAMRDMREGYNLYPDGLPDEVHQKLARRYAELFSIFHKYADKISRITFWGVYDGSSWKNNWPVRGCTDYPLLFDRDYKPKPACDAVVNVARGDE